MTTVQLKTFVLPLLGGITILSGVTFLIALTTPRLGRAILGNFAPDYFSDRRMRRFTYIRAMSLSFMYILFGIAIALMSTSNSSIAWLLIALGILCGIFVVVFQSLITGEDHS